MHHLLLRQVKKVLDIAGFMIKEILMQNFKDSCTTVLVGRKATVDGSTLIARNEDGDVAIDPKKCVVIMPNEQPTVYHSASEKFCITLPENPLKYTSTPGANTAAGVWGESGINGANVAMSATETITSNSRILGVDPYVQNGFGEEDMLTIVLPYIQTASEGVDRLGALLEEYGTYEANGIAFSDKDEIWWLETIGGHNWVAMRIPDDAYVVAPNRFNIDHFDFTSPNVKFSNGLEQLIIDNHLNPAKKGYNLRNIFGSASVKDTRYSNPRAWYIQKYFNPSTIQDPIDQNLPFLCYAEKKISVEDVKWVLSSHFQDTPFDPYGSGSPKEKKRFRPVAINRNSESHVLQIKKDLPAEFSAIHWVAFGPNTFNYLIPVFANVEKTPAFLADTTTEYNLNSIYWLSYTAALIGDNNFNICDAIYERYEQKVAAQFNASVADMEKNAITKANIPEYLESLNEKNAAVYAANYTQMLGEMVQVGAQNMELRFNLTDL